MKIFNIVFSVLAVLFIIVNLLKVNVNNLFEGDSGIALIGVVAALIVLVLLLILKKAKAIEKKIK